MADDDNDDQKSNIIPFGERGISRANLNHIDLTKVRLDDLVNIIEACDYEGEPGSLTNSREWLELKRRLNLPPTFSPDTGT